MEGWEVIDDRFVNRAICNFALLSIVLLIKRTPKLMTKVQDSSTAVRLKYWGCLAVSGVHYRTDPILPFVNLSILEEADT
jgi:hypothetical protein